MVVFATNASTSDRDVCLKRTNSNFADEQCSAGLLPNLQPFFSSSIAFAKMQSQRASSTKSCGISPLMMTFSILLIAFFNGSLQDFFFIAWYSHDIFTDAFVELTQHNNQISIRYGNCALLIFFINPQKLFLIDHCWCAVKQTMARSCAWSERAFTRKALHTCTGTIPQQVVN